MPHLHSDVEKKTDPVCGMYLDNYPDLVSARHAGKEYPFCGEGCRERFRSDPDKFFGTPIIRLRDVQKTFRIGRGEIGVLRGVNLNVWAGDFLAIIGPSGSGKSTILNMIGLLDQPSSGEVVIKGKDASKFSDEERARLRSTTFGFVFQQYNLIPWLNIYDNIHLPMIFSKKDSREKRKEIEAKIAEIGLADRLAHHPFELSGGEQQRVALLRALANDPEVIIGDEPTGNLDSQTGKKILGMLIELHRRMQKTLIIVTHDASIADQAEEVVVVKDGITVRDQRVHQKLYVP